MQREEMRAIGWQTFEPPRWDEAAATLPGTFRHKNRSSLVFLEVETMSPHPRLVPFVVAISVAIIGWLPSTSTAQTAKDDTQSLLLELKALKPATRLEALAKLLDKGDFQPVSRGKVLDIVAVSGSVECSDRGNIVCALRPLKPDSPVASTIRWLVDEGSIVKAGQKVIVFDDSSRIEQLKAQEITTAEGKIAFLEAKTRVSQIEDEMRLELRLAEIGLKLASLELEKYSGKERLDKQLLELKVEQAKLILDQVKLKSVGRLEKAKADFALRELIFERNMERERELKDDIRKCEIVAQKNGILLYHHDFQIGRRSYSVPRKIVAEGEPVSEGQRVMYVGELSKLQLDVFVPEAVVSKVFKGQKAHISFRAHPKKLVSGEVRFVGNESFQPDILNRDVRMYLAVIEREGDLTGLKPRMAGTADINVGQRDNVLRVPLTAVIDGNAAKYCIVMADKEIHIRAVQVGARGGGFAEIEQGLSEGDQIMVDPVAVANRWR